MLKSLGDPPVGGYCDIDEKIRYPVVYPKTRQTEIWLNWQQCRAAISGKVAIHQKCGNGFLADQFIEQVIAEL